ncbi:hypothetical protein LSM04_003214 [Trypanosoma melophagium]|uniref:uncharacterized protein n=1 Tax=Trypanosoma melophagium TaxID=715481 RepID=UPI003519EB97|nr:hypothetical protein LSM04_003214 [Trypanosoma melophagium]
MAVDNAGYVWHNMPEEVRRNIERRRSAAGDPEEAAGTPPLAPAVKADRAEKDAHCKVNKAQQTVDSREYPRNKEEPENHELNEKNKYPRDEEEPPHNEEEEKWEYPEEEEEPQQHEEEGKREYPEKEEGEAQKQEEEDVSQDADQRKESEDVEVQQPQTVGSSKDARTKHTIRFRGPKWDNVLQNHRNELETAFKKDVTEASDLPEERISGLQFQVDDVLVALFTVRHENDEEKMNEVHPKLRSYSFPHTTGLYMKEKDNQNPEEDETPQDADQRRGSQNVDVQKPQTVGSKRNGKTNHTVHFRGPKWDNVLQNHRNELETAFKKDVTEASDLPEERISGLQFQFDDVLIVKFAVHHENDEEKMNEVHPKLRSYSFPHTTGLYMKEKDNQNPEEDETPQDADQRRGSQNVDVQKPQTVGSKRNGKTNHTVHFRGPKWENVLQNDRNELETAFKKDVTEASDLPEERISGLQFQFDDVLIVKFAVHHENDEEKMNEVHPKLRSYSFPHTTALY